MKRLEKLRRMQIQSLGFLVIRCGQLWNERGIASVNLAAGAPVFREAHTKLLPHLQDPAGIRITELAKRVGVTKQAVQPIVAELVESGIVRVEVDREDARARRVYLTPMGVEAMLHGTGVLTAIEKALVPSLGKTRVATLKRELLQLLRVLDAGMPPQTST